MKSTVDWVLPLVNSYYQLPGNGNGGNFHCILEDSNVSNQDVNWAIDRSIEQGDLAGTSLGIILLQMSRTQRLKLGERHDYPVRCA